MSTSIHEGIVSLGASLYGTDDDPVDALIWRDGLANGLLHAADSYAQVRVNLAYPTGTYLSGKAAPTAGQWHRIGGSFGKWPLTIHANGTPYELRVRVGVSASTGGTAQTIRVVIAPDDEATTELGREADHVYELTTSSGSAAWVAGTSQGSVGSATRMIVSPADAARWTRDVNAFDAVASATPRATRQSLVSAHVFFRSASGSVTTRLHNLYIAEYVGL